MLCRVASSKRQKWGQRRLQEKLFSRAVGKGLQKQPALTRVLQQSSSPPPACLRLLELRAVGGARVHLHTSLQSLTSDRVGTGTTITVVRVTRQESAFRGLLASLLSPLTPSSHLSRMLLLP